MVWLYNLFPPIRYIFYENSRTHNIGASILGLNLVSYCLNHFRLELMKYYGSMVFSVNMVLLTIWQFRLIRKLIITCLDTIRILLVLILFLACCMVSEINYLRSNTGIYLQLKLADLFTPITNQFMPILNQFRKQIYVRENLFGEDIFKIFLVLLSWLSYVVQEKLLVCVSIMVNKYIHQIVLEYLLLHILVVGKVFTIVVLFIAVSWLYLIQFINQSGGQSKKAELSEFRNQIYQEYIFDEYENESIIKPLDILYELLYEQLLHTDLILSQLIVFVYQYSWLLWSEPDLRIIMTLGLIELECGTFGIKDCKKQIIPAEMGETFLDVTKMLLYFVIFLKRCIVDIHLDIDNMNCGYSKPGPELYCLATSKLGRGNPGKELVGQLFFVSGLIYDTAGITILALGSVDKETVGEEETNLLATNVLNILFNPSLFISFISFILFISLALLNENDNKLKIIVSIDSLMNENIKNNQIEKALKLYDNTKSISNNICQMVTNDTGLATNETIETSAIISETNDGTGLETDKIIQSMVTTNGNGLGSTFSCYQESKSTEIVIVTRGGKKLELEPRGVVTDDETFTNHAAQLVTSKVGKEPSIAKEIKNFIFEASLIEFILGIIFLKIGMVENQNLVVNVVVLIGIIMVSVYEELLITVTVLLILITRRIFDENVSVKNLQSDAELAPNHLVYDNKLCIVEKVLIALTLKNILCGIVSRPTPSTRASVLLCDIINESFIEATGNYQLPHQDEMNYMYGNFRFRVVPFNIYEAYDTNPYSYNITPLLNNGYCGLQQHNYQTPQSIPHTYHIQLPHTYIPIHNNICIYNKYLSSINNSLYAYITNNITIYTSHVIIIITTIPTLSNNNNTVYYLQRCDGAESLINANISGVIIIVLTLQRMVCDMALQGVMQSALILSGIVYEVVIQLIEMLLELEINYEIELRRIALIFVLCIFVLLYDKYLVILYGIASTYGRRSCDAVIVLIRLILYGILCGILELIILIRKKYFQEILIENKISYYFGINLSLQEIWARLLRYLVDIRREGEKEAEYCAVLFQISILLLTASILTLLYDTLILISYISFRNGYQCGIINKQEENKLRYREREMVKYLQQLLLSARIFMVQILCKICVVITLVLIIIYYLYILCQLFY